MTNQRYEKYKETYTQYRLKHKEEIKEYRKEQREEHKLYMRLWRKNNRTKNNLIIKNWGVRNPEKIKAQNYINHLVRDGFPTAKNFKCCNCNKQAQQYHHYNGYKPFDNLNIMPLCNPCHKIMDTIK